MKENNDNQVLSKNVRLCSDHSSLLVEVWVGIWDGWGLGLVLNNIIQMNIRLKLLNTSHILRLNSQFSFHTQA